MDLRRVEVATGVRSEGVKFRTGQDGNALFF